MLRKYKLAIFIGRFQPFHAAHMEVVEHALEVADSVLILVGSSNQPRDIRNPFTFEERREMISRSVRVGDIGRVHIWPIEDFRYNDVAWISQIQSLVRNLYGQLSKEEIALIGHDKEDGTGYYLKMFPHWQSESVGLRRDGLNSTQIRKAFFTDEKNWQKYKSLVPFGTSLVLNRMSVQSDVADLIQEEYEFQRLHDEKWAGTPHPVLFQTVDSCVIQSGHILLIQRRSAPGRGTWALPGGYLEVGELAFDGSIRELREETRLKVPEAVLRGSMVYNRRFDDPRRSTRGRIITEAFLYHLNPDYDLPKVKGDSDAAKAKWWLLADVKRQMMFEDHMDIIKNLVSRL